MTTSMSHDGGPLKERTTILPEATGEVEIQMQNITASASVANFGTSSLPYSGIIYRRWLDKSDCPDHGKSYIGETMDETTRIRSWNKSSSSSYAGSKIKTARDKYGLHCWGYEVLEIVYASSVKELENLLYEREIFYISRFDSYENGFNGNRGGRGNNGVVFDEVRRQQNGDNRRGKSQRPETIEMIRQKSRGRVKSREERVKISKGNSGKKRTDEMREAQSKRMKGIEPKAASDAAKAWREANGGSFWKGKKLNSSAIEKRNETHRLTSQRFKVISKNGMTSYYLCQTDAARATGVKDGSIKYALDKNNGLHLKSGYTFVRISDSEYQESSQPQILK